MVAILFLYACSACSPSHERPGAEYQWLDTNLVSRLKNADSEFALERPALEFNAGETVSTCRQYLGQKGELTESSQNFSARSHYLVCDALGLLDTYPLPAVGTESQIGVEICSKLNLATFSHSFRQSFDGNEVFVSQLPDGRVSAKGNVCQFQNEDRNFVLTAVLQTQSENEPKLLWVWVTDEILDGTYRSYEPVWFVFDEKRNMWLAKS